MFYRKLYMECGLFVLCTALIGFVLGDVGLAVSVIVAMQAKPIYFMRAKRNIITVRNGKITELWRVADDWSRVKQLGGHAAWPSA